MYPSRLHTCLPVQGVIVDPSDIALLAGAGACLQARVVAGGCTLHSQWLPGLCGLKAVRRPSYSLQLSCLPARQALFHLLCDKGDGVLLPLPTYPSFINDIEARAAGRAPHCQDLHPSPVGCGLQACAQAVPIMFSLPDEADSVGEQLTAAAARAAAQGNPVKVLLVTNPTNPLGTM